MNGSDVLTGIPKDIKTFFNKITMDPPTGILFQKCLQKKKTIRLHILKLKAVVFIFVIDSYFRFFS